MNFYIVRKHDDPFVVFVPNGIVVGMYASKRTVIANLGLETWAKWEGAAETFETLGFEDGLIIEPVGDAGDGRLILSSLSLHMLFLANAKQRENLDANSRTFCERFFTREADCNRAHDWLSNTWLALMQPTKYPPTLLSGMEMASRGRVWTALAFEDGRTTQS